MNIVFVSKQKFCAILMFLFFLSNLSALVLKFAVTMLFYHLVVSEMSKVEQLDEGDDIKEGWRERECFCLLV